MFYCERCNFSSLDTAAVVVACAPPYTFILETEADLKRCVGRLMPPFRLMLELRSSRALSDILYLLATDLGLTERLPAVIIA